MDDKGLQDEKSTQELFALSEAEVAYMTPKDCLDYLSNNVGVNIPSDDIEKINTQMGFLISLVPPLAEDDLADHEKIYLPDGLEIEVNKKNWDLTLLASYSHWIDDLFDDGYIKFEDFIAFFESNNLNIQNLKEFFQIQNLEEKNFYLDFDSISFYLDYFDSAFDNIQKTELMENTYKIAKASKIFQGELNNLSREDKKDLLLSTSSLNLFYIIFEERNNPDWKIFIKRLNESLAPITFLFNPTQKEIEMMDSSKELFDDLIKTDLDELADDDLSKKMIVSSMKNLIGFFNFIGSAREEELFSYVINLYRKSF